MEWEGGGTRVNRKDGGGEGGNGEAETVEGGGPWGGGKGERGGDLEVGGGEAEMAMGRGRWATGRGRLGGGNREGEMGKGDFTDEYNEILRWTYGMLGWNEVTEFSDFVHPCNAGYTS